MRHTTVGSILRSSQAWYSQICATESLDSGIAYWSTAYPTVADANQFREVMIPDPAALPEAFAAAERFFAERGPRCYRWAPAAEQPVRPFEAFLEPIGYRRRDLRAMLLTSWPHVPRNEAVRILPARAMRAAFRQTHLGSSSDPTGGAADDVLAAVAAERLDDPQLDMFVAIHANRPAGRCALFQVGDIARIIDLHVAPESRRQGVASALLTHVLTLAQRLAPRVACAQVECVDAAAGALFEKFGFRDDGSIVEFDAPHKPTATAQT